jgi:predicted molibdopterin-dependent oxidoreductase YjgC
LNYITIPTTCVYCGCGCELLLEVLDGELVGVLPGKSNPINHGGLCIKGWNAHEFVVSEKRLRTPLVRKNGELQEASWEEALSVVSSKLKALIESSGPESIACLSSAKCTNEENYLMQKLMRAAVGTNNVDHCARL